MFTSNKHINSTYEQAISYTALVLWYKQTSSNYTLHLYIPFCCKKGILNGKAKLIADMDPVNLRSGR